MVKGSAPIPSQWQGLNPVPHFFKTHQRRDQDEIFDRATYGHPQLMGIDQAGEVAPACLPRRCQSQEVAVLREYDTTEFRRPLQEEYVASVRLAILICR